MHEYMNINEEFTAMTPSLAGRTAKPSLAASSILLRVNSHWRPFFKKVESKRSQLGTNVNATPVGHRWHELRAQIHYCLERSIQL
jgi:hypothetical protein